MKQCFDCGQVLTQEELEYYGHTCEVCESINYLEFINEEYQLMGKNDLIDLAVITIRATEKAYLVSDGIVQAWLPKSQTDVITVDANNLPRLIKIPEWLANKSKLI